MKKHWNPQVLEQPENIKLRSEGLAPLLYSQTHPLYLEAEILGGKIYLGIKGNDSEQLAIKRIKLGSPLIVVLGVCFK